MSVEALNCPNCGGGVSSDRTLCEFCKTRLKTVGCPKCLGLMFIGTKFCGRCGAMAAPIDASLSDESGDCPRCRKQLETLRVAESLFHGCKSCDGLWVGVETFENICADREKQSAVPGFLAMRKSQLNVLTKVSYVPCPDCGELMNRNNFARASGVIVDICKKHGVWFDFDELPSIIEFIHKGGLEKMRERERAEIRDERDKLREEQRKFAAGARRDGGAAWSTADESGIRGFVHSLFE
jgi:Zn-finger nucleic acid-binding protein